LQKVPWLVLVLLRYWQTTERRPGMHLSIVEETFLVVLLLEPLVRKLSRELEVAIAKAVKTEAGRDLAADTPILKSKLLLDLLLLVLRLQLQLNMPKIAKQTTRKWAEVAVGLEAFPDVAVLVLTTMIIHLTIAHEVRVDTMIQNTELHKWLRLVPPQPQSQESLSISETNLESVVENVLVHV
jgi:hypothetical protein